MKRCLYIYSLFLTASLLCSGFCSAAPKWTTEPWDASDSALLRVEANFAWQTQNLKQKDFSALVETYKSESEARPEDSLAQYKYAISLYEYNGKYLKIYSPRDFVNLNVRLEACALPRSYKYARMLFIVRGLTGFHMHELFGVGQRLLKRNAGDIAVLSQIPKTVIYENPKQRAAALNAANTVLRLRPQSSSALELVALAYDNAWYATRNTSYSAKAWGTTSSC